METVVWLWLYDRRWFFGIKAPSLLKIWSVPIFNNAFFFVTLLYYVSTQSDQCYNTFKDWIYVRLVMLAFTLVAIVRIFQSTFMSKKEEYTEIETYKTVNPILVKNYNFWITRKVLLSWPGLILLLLGLMNWYWIIRGMNMVYSDMGGIALAGCGGFVHNVVWGNLVLTGLISLPVFWVLFWMICIKGSCIILGLISPSMLIKLKKGLA